MIKRRFLLQTLAILAGAATLAPGLMAQTRPRVEVWKDPDCGCCKDWVSHLEASGFQVKVHDSGNAAARARLACLKNWAPATPRRSAAMRSKAMCRRATSGGC